MVNPLSTLYLLWAYARCLWVVAGSEDGPHWAAFLHPYIVNLMDKSDIVYCLKAAEC